MTDASGESVLLTEAEVMALAEGTPITVQWSGGNGPWFYVVEVDPTGLRFAGAKHDDQSPYYMRFDPARLLHFVGQERFHTRVWAAHADEKETS